MRDECAVLPENYVPPSTKGARPIRSLPYGITAAGSYYLDSDLTSKGNGIYVLYKDGQPIDINLNGHTITYGTVVNRIRSNCNRRIWNSFLLSGFSVRRELSEQRVLRDRRNVSR